MKIIINKSLKLHNIRRYIKQDKVTMQSTFVFFIIIISQIMIDNVIV